MAITKLRQDIINMSSSFIALLLPIPHESIILNHIVIFHVQDENEQMLFQSQHAWSLGHPANLHWGRLIVHFLPPTLSM